MNPYALFLGSRNAREVIVSTPLDLRHLADCEIVFAFRLRQALAEEHHVVQPFDQNHWARPYGTADAEVALTTFAAVRSWNLALLKTVTPAQAAKRLTHPERGEMPFEVLVETMGGHDLNHVKQLEAIASSTRD